MAFAFTKNQLEKLPMVSIAQHKQLVTGVVIAAGAIPLLANSISAYRGWMALGKGGLPHNVFGWLINVLLHPISRSDTRVPGPYTLESTEAVWGPAGRQSYYEGSAPSLRVGARPNVPTYVAPQRQITEQGAPEMIKRMDDFLDALVAANPEILQIKPSGLEHPERNALFLADKLSYPAHLENTNKEIAHVHEEGSTHITLSLSDSARAIELGWAERHKLSGITKGLPWGYVMLYAPRNDSELEDWKRFVLAATKFNASTAGGSAVYLP
ncbi:hypothetical protein BX600DRAFT_505945 [Xylariales sp. PMI_506]|nr:hypothetical protein BX600DRAFT_505945 [Xylariales sp. PMI_506]